MSSHEVDVIAARVLDAHPHLNLVHHLVLLKREDRFVKQDLVRIIQRDPQLGPRVRAGYLAPIRDHSAAPPTLIRDALDQVGYRRLHSTSMMISFVYAFGAHRLPDAYAPYWRRLFATAWTAVGLAGGRPGGTGDRAVAAALFGEAGWFLFQRYAPDDFSRLELLARAHTAEDGRFADAVRCTLGFHPQDVVRVCAVEWGLPDWLVESLVPDDAAPLRGIVEDSRALAAALGWKTPWAAPEAEVPRPRQEARARLDAYAREEPLDEWLQARVAAQLASAHLAA